VCSIAGGCQNDILKNELTWNKLFIDINWESEITDKIIPASEIFNINRGERRGWDKMFYPDSGNSIEIDYLKPVLKNPKEILSLVTSAKSFAFCCNKTIDELKILGHLNTLNWINKFEFESNEKGKPLIKVLSREGSLWYEMNDSNMADFVANINYNDRLFIAKLENRSFVNQRFTRLKIKNNETNLDFIHALLNSTLGLYFIESIGFGRALGALDLSTERLGNLKMLNPNIIKLNTQLDIISSFNKIKNREILPLLEELERGDRIEFDKIVLESFGIANYQMKIYESIKELFKMRKMNID